MYLCFVFFKQLIIDAIMLEICVPYSRTCTCIFKHKKISSNPCCVFKAMDVLFVNLWQSMVTQKLYDLCTNYWSVNNQNDGKYNIKVLKKTLVLNLSLMIEMNRSLCNLNYTNLLYKSP